MKIHSKFNPWIIGQEMPEMAMQIAESECLHCGSMMRFPVEETYIDWKIVAEGYRNVYSRMTERFDRLVSDIDVMNPGPNPIREYITNEWAAIMNDMRREFEQ